MHECNCFSSMLGRSAVSLLVSHSLTGSYDLWIVRLVAIGPRCADRQCLLRSSIAVSISRSITIVRLVVAINDRCKINLDGQRPMVRSIDRCILRLIYEQSWHLVTDRTSTRGILWPSVRSIVTPEYRWYDQLWGATINRKINRSIVWPIVRSIVATYDRSHLFSGDIGHQYILVTKSFTYRTNTKYVLDGHAKKLAEYHYVDKMDGFVASIQ